MTNSVPVSLKDSIWCLNTAFRIKGDELTPETTLLYLKTSVSWFSSFINPKNLKQSQPFFASISFFQKAFSISAINATLLALNLNKISRIDGAKGGPTWRQSSSDVPFLQFLHDASNTTLTFVVQNRPALLPFVEGSELYRLAPDLLRFE